MAVKSSAEFCMPCPCAGVVNVDLNDFPLPICCSHGYGVRNILNYIDGRNRRDKVHNTVLRRTIHLLPMGI